MKPLLKSSRGKIQKVYGGWEVTRNGITSFYATIDEMPWRDRWLTKSVPFFVVAFVLGWIVLLPFMLVLYCVLQPLSKLFGFKNPIKLELNDKKEMRRG